MLGRSRLMFAGYKDPAAEADIRARGHQQQNIELWNKKWLTEELSGLARMRQWEGAIATFVSAAVPVPGSKPMVTPNEFHYTTVISACGRVGRWHEALNVFSHMVARPDLKPNPYTFSALIHACSEGSKPDVALKVFATMQQYNVPANLYTLTSVVTACSKAGQWQKAIAVLDAAEDSLIAPNEITYTAAIDGCRRAGRWDTAMSLVGQMYKQREVRPTDVTWNTVIKSCAVAGEWGPALQSYSAMRAAGYHPVKYTQDSLEQVFESSEELRGSTEDIAMTSSRAMYMLRMTESYKTKR